jgi:hypothetical protein
VSSEPAGTAKCNDPTLTALIPGSPTWIDTVPGALLHSLGCCGHPARQLGGSVEVLLGRTHPQPVHTMLMPPAAVKTGPWSFVAKDR